MLAPKRVKFRKQQKGRMRGAAFRGSSISFGDFGLKAINCGYLTSRQIEAARVAITRHVKRGGKVWIRIFPDKPFTKKPAEVHGVTEEVAREALNLAARKLPVSTRFVSRQDVL